MNWKITLTTLLGSLFIVIGVSLQFFIPIILEASLAKNLVIAPDSEILKVFEKSPVPLYLQLYLFNITNPDEIYEGATPILSQLGPYTYREEKTKLNITWNHVLGTVSYNEQHFFYFEPDKSNGSEYDQITTLNVIFVTAAVIGEDLHYLQQSMLQMLAWQFKNYHLFMTRTVKELTFTGYVDPMMKNLHAFAPHRLYAGGKTGFLYPANGSIGPTLEVYSGESGMENYQKIHKSNGETKLKTWKGDDCNRIKGTFGSQFPRPIIKTEPLLTFSRMFCRTMYFTYENDTKLGPLTLNRFSNQIVFSRNEATNCYCPDKFTCRNTMTSMSSCWHGVPVVMSGPHFYMGNDEDVNMVEGMNPSKSDHQTYLEVEPNTGMVMRAALRVQFNVAIKRYSTFYNFDKVKEVIFPLLWVNKSLEVPLDKAEAMHEALIAPKIMIEYFSLIVGLVGFTLIMVILFTISCRKNGEIEVRKRQKICDKEANVKDINGLLK